MSLTPTFEGTRADYTALLSKSQIRPEWTGAYERAADYIIRHRVRYEQVARRMGTIPWALIGCLHWREANGSFAGVLHNGDKIIGTGRKTFHVPAGRGPFDSWEAAAVDALKMKNLDKLGDWSLERVAYEAERFNGFGYRMHYPDIKSPYLWSGTNNYSRGKYTSDGHMDRSHKDQQLGVMPLYQMILDKTAPTQVLRTSLVEKIRGSIKWIGGAVGSLFTMDNLGYLRDLHASLDGMFDAKLVGALILTGGVAWILLKLLDGGPDVGPDTEPAA